MKVSQKVDELQLVELTRIKESAFKPLFYLSNRHLQTILANIVHPSFPELTKQRLELDDGDFIDLLWSKTRAPQTLLILHGLEGSIHSAYAKRMLNYCNNHQIAAIFMHFRGCSGEPNRLLRGYHSGETDDLRRVIDHLKSNVSPISPCSVIRSAATRRLNIWARQKPTRPFVVQPRSRYHYGLISAPTP